jgi:hypothetical protein
LAEKKGVTGRKPVTPLSVIERVVAPLCYVLRKPYASARPLIIKRFSKARCTKVVRCTT